MNQLLVPGISWFFFLFVLLFLGVFLGFFFFYKRQKKNLRWLQAYQDLIKSMVVAVESGRGLHVSLGRGKLTGEQSPASLAAITVQEKILNDTVNSDSPPLATSGESLLSVLAMDACQRSRTEDELKMERLSTCAQLTGLTAYSYAAGSLLELAAPMFSGHVLVGHFGSEIALMTDAVERNGELTLAGTDHLPAQAVIYTAVEHPLIGEELYAGGAYLDSGPQHLASVSAQDVFRWLLVGGILLGVILRIVGLL